MPDYYLVTRVRIFVRTPRNCSQELRLHMFSINTNIFGTGLSAGTEIRR